MTVSSRNETDMPYVKRFQFFILCFAQLNTSGYDLRDEKVVPKTYVSAQ